MENKNIVWATRKKVIAKSPSRQSTAIVCAPVDCLSNSDFTGEENGVLRPLGIFSLYRAYTI